MDKSDAGTFKMAVDKSNGVFPYKGIKISTYATWINLKNMLKETKQKTQTVCTIPFIKCSEKANLYTELYA